MADSVEDLFCKRLDGYIDQWAEEIGYARVEAILQDRAQDMRELVEADASVETITADDLDGWSAEDDGG
jgi:hypothetical protein